MIFFVARINQYFHIIVTTVQWDGDGMTQQGGGDATIL
jgi:hypothetical protein